MAWSACAAVCAAAAAVHALLALPASATRPPPRGSALAQDRVVARHGAEDGPGPDDAPHVYSAVLDLGSTGCRIHVWRFDARTHGLLDIGDAPEVFVQTEPGVSSCGVDDPACVRKLIDPLVAAAVAAVPEAARPSTPLAVRGTGGLRLLDQESREWLLRQVRGLVGRGGFRDAGVQVMDGDDEGANMWVAVNYLLSSAAHGQYAPAVVVDLGGASVQIAYAAGAQAAGAGKGGLSPLQDPNYMCDAAVPGQPSGFKLYRKSHKYGIMQGRAWMFSLAKDEGLEEENPCLFKGFQDLSATQGTFSYDNHNYHGKGTGDASACMKLVTKTFHLEDSCGAHAGVGQGCSFDGAWAGPGWGGAAASLAAEGGAPAGQPRIAACSAIYDALLYVGVIPEGVKSTKAKPRDYVELAKKICGMPLSEVRKQYPMLPEKVAPWICFDLSFSAAFLIRGMGLDPGREILVIKEIPYQGRDNHMISASWPLGVALDGLGVAGSCARVGRRGAGVVTER